MKKPVLVLLALIPFAQTMAQTPQMAAPPGNPAAASATDATAHFLATLSGAQTQTPNDLTPAPSFMTGCTSNAQCPASQFCCNVCGFLPAKGTSLNCMACVTPVNGHCPRVV